MRYKQSKCECDNTKKSHVNPKDNICSAMPVFDISSGDGTDDRVILSRTWTRPDHYGKSIPSCQVVSMGIDDFCEYIAEKTSVDNVCDATGPVPANPTRLCY